MGENPSPAQVLEAVKMLSEQYEQNSAANRALSKEVARRKRETRWVALAVALVVTIAVCSWLVVRHNDRRAESERRERLASQIFTQRESLVQGCERANDGRRTDAEIISRAIQPSPDPPNTTDPDILELLHQSRERTIALREELLSLPGVQIVDCQAAHPLPRLDR